MEKYIYLFCLYLFSSCANIVPLSGGEKDNEGPKVIRTSPNNLSTSFDKKNIIIEFDEFIEFNKINNIRLSPSCGEPPKFNIVGKTLYMNLFCDLDSNTTYNINLSQNIKDLNEGNILDNYSFIFSTGKYIDSLKLSGKIKDLYYGNTVKGALVGLYKYDEEVGSSIPYYYAFSDEEGKFDIGNIAGGDYLIFGFLDDDKNTSVGQNETASNPFNIAIYNNQSNIDVGLFKQKNKKWKSPNNYNKGVVKFTESESDSLSVLNTLGYWNKNDFWVDGSVKIVQWEKNGEIDSVNLYNQEVLNLDLKLKSSLSEILKQKKIVIKSNKPIKKLDSVLSPKLFLKDPFTIEKYINPKIGDRIDLIIQEGAIIDNDNYTNDSLNFKLDFNQNLFGSIIIRNQSQNQQQIELYQQEKIIYSDLLIDSVKISWLQPGTYKLRTFIDRNNNKLWDTGSIKLNDVSEEIFIYPEQINIRPNWEIELIIN